MAKEIDDFFTRSQHVLAHTFHTMNIYTSSRNGLEREKILKQVVCGIILDGQNNSQLPCIIRHLLSGSTVQ